MSGRKRRSGKAVSERNRSVVAACGGHDRIETRAALCDAIRWRAVASLVTRTGVTERATLGISGLRNRDLALKGVGRADSV